MNLRSDFRICADAPSIAAPAVDFTYRRKLQRPSRLRYKLLAGERRWREAGPRRPYPHEELTKSCLDRPGLAREPGNVAAQRVP